MNSKLRTLLAAAVLTAGTAMGQSFTAIENWSDTFGICGSPGQRLCSNLKCAPPSSTTLQIDPFTHEQWCDLPAPSCNVFPYPVNYGNPDVTFLIVTDMHLRNGWGIKDADHVRHVNNLNLLPQLGFDWSQAGAGFDQKALGTPIAVVTTGDDTDGGLQTQLGAYRLLYDNLVYDPGSTNSAIHYPIYPGLGNHDVQNQCLDDSCALRMFNYVGQVSACAATVDSLSHNYSWDWGPFHMIQLNEWAGSVNLGTDDHGNVYSHVPGLTWLADDLSTHVGSSGRPVILFQHFGWDEWSLGNNNNGAPWWSASQQSALLNILGPYNVIGLFSGHQHATGMYSTTYTDPSGNSKTLDDFTGGSGGIQKSGDPSPNGQFFAVRLTNNFLDVMPFEWTDTDWTSTEHFTLPYIRDIGNGEGGYARAPFYNDVNGCRKWIGPALQAIPLPVSVNGSGVTLMNNTGGTVKGPFAVRFKLHSPDTLGSVSFTGSCAQGPVYQEIPDSKLAPEQQANAIVLTNAQGVGLTGYKASEFQVVALGGDSLVSTQASVSLTGSSQQVVLSTLFGRNTKFTYAVSGSGVIVSSNSTQTPATLTISLNEKVPTVSDNGLIMVTPSDPQYLPVNIKVTLGTVPIKVQSSTGDPITVDGQSYPSPTTFNWLPGGVHNLAAPLQQKSAGVQDRFVSWSNGGAESQQVTTPWFPATYMANYLKYYLVIPAVNSSTEGSVLLTPNSADGYYTAGTAVTAQATPFAGFSFFMFQGVSPAPAGSSFRASINGPLAFTAVFGPTGIFTLATDLGSAGQVTADGTVYAGTTLVRWNPGSSHTISVPVEFDSAPGERYIFTGWSNGVTTSGETIAVGSTGTYVAHYQLQYLVTAAVTPAGEGTLTGGGWQPDGASATLTAIPAEGFVFSGFSGGLSGNNNPQSLVVEKPGTVTATFAPTPPTLFIFEQAPQNANTLTIVVKDIGTVVALDAQIDSITPLVPGSGITVTSSLPVKFGTIAMGAESLQSIQFDWPSTADSYGEFTVKFSVNGGAYHGEATIYLWL